MKKIVIVIIVILFIIIGLIAFSMSPKPNQGGEKMVEKNQAAVDFTLSDLSGNQISLSGQKGKVVFLNFWATWCPPCRGEMPSIQKLHEAMQGKDFIVLAVSIGEKDQTVKGFIENNNYTFPVLLDPDNKVAGDYSVMGIPTTLIIDKEGRVVLNETGSRNWASPEVIAEIEKLLK